jgi:hypothetical protein
VRFRISILVKPLLYTIPRVCIPISVVGELFLKPDIQNEPYDEVIRKACMKGHHKLITVLSQAR